MVVLTPKEKFYYKRIETGEIFGGVLYLGIYDKPENYVLVDEAEYQEYLKKQKLERLRQEQIQ